MNITRNQVDENYFKLLVNVSPDDYLPRVNDEIKSLSKKVAINGFRQGKVPPGLTKKFYGTPVLVEELQKMLNDVIVNYIKENQLRVMFQPIPFSVGEQAPDIHNPESYNFGFEVGLIPALNFPDLQQITVGKKQLIVTDKMVDEEADRLRTLKGERSYPETIAEGDALSGTWNELNESGEIKENGIESQSTFSLNIIKDDVVKQQLLSLKKEEATDFNIRAAFGNEDELIIHNILKTDHHAAENMNERFRFTLKNFVRIAKAELNQEFFDKVFGKDVIKSEEEFRERIKTDLNNQFEGYASSIVTRDVQQELMKNIQIDLPAEFIRHYLDSNKEEGKDDIGDDELIKFLEQLKWQLIHEKIVHENKLEATRDDLVAKAKIQLANYYGGVTVFGDDANFEKIAESLLSDQKIAERFQSEILSEKVINWLTSQVKIEIAEADQHEFFHH